MKIPALVLAIALFAPPAFAADIDGRWTGTMTTPMGDFPIAFIFKAEGDALTGAMIGMDGMEIPIADGKVDGDNVSYVVKLDFGGMPFEMAYKGIVSGDELKLTGEVFGMPFELVVRKE